MNNWKKIEDGYLGEAVKKFQKLTGASVKKLSLSGREMRADALLEIRFNEVVQKFKVEVKGELRQNQVLPILEQFGKQTNKWLLIAKYIPQPLKEYLKQQSINYLEITGNCHIHVPKIFIYISDQRVTPVRETASGRLWTSTGLKFLLAIISNPFLLDSSYRNIASTAGIALGSIGPLLKELEQSGFIKVTGANEVDELTNIEQLISRWTELYHSLLRPQLLKGKFRFMQRENLKNWKMIKADDIFWGAEPGAALITEMLTPQHFTIYTDRPGKDLTKNPGIVPDTNGNITLLEKCWGNNLSLKPISFKETIYAQPAPALLIYAELIYDLDSRNREIAEHIKKTYLWQNIH